MKLDRSWVTALVVGVVALTSGGWLLQQGVGSGDSAYQSARLLEEVHRLIAERYVDEIDPSELYQMAIDGMLREIGDPYTSFLDKDDWSDLRLTTTGNYGGLGIRIEAKDGWITVVGVMPNTPAERQGLEIGDRIVEVEGESAEDWTGDQAVQNLRGPKGSKVNIAIARVGVDRPIPFTIERDVIYVEAVTAFAVDNEIGYVRLNNFSRVARAEVKEAIDQLIADGSSSIVFDLRTNPGGLLEEGIAVSDLFLPRGVDVVSTKSRLADQNHTFRAPAPQVYEGIPVVVLVNNWSASAAEIVAGALQDHDRALIIGTNTFGKGSVQTLYGLSGDNHIKVTTAKWYTPSGRSIQKEFDPESAMSGLTAEVVSVTGEPVAIRETEVEREEFQTASGRTVYGGGGIAPDIIVMPDTLSSREQDLSMAVVDAGVSWRNVTFRFGVEWAKDNPGLTRDFKVTSGMRNAFFDYLAAEGVELDRELFDDASSIVDWWLGIEIANAAFGDQARQQRRLVRDTQMDEALRFLRQADSPEELLSLAMAERAAAVESVAPPPDSDY
jgi:carboxyl-terminal processing protease